MCPYKFRGKCTMNARQCHDKCVLELNQAAMQRLRSLSDDQRACIAFKYYNGVAVWDLPQNAEVLE